MTTIGEQYEALRRGHGLVVLDRDVVEVKGPEAEKFLQGQLSQDLGPIAVGTGARTFVLEPTGKVAAWMRVTRLADDAFLLDVEQGFGDAVVGRLNRFKLRTKAEIQMVDGWTCAVHPLGPEPRQFLVEASVGLVSYQLGGAGYFLSRDAAFTINSLTAVDALAYEPWRIEMGVPRMGAELIAGATIPGEAGDWVITESVSFTKGCYTGQELVARIDSRGGNVPRPVRPFVIESGADAIPPVGAQVVVDEKVVGTLTSVAWSPGFDAPVALGPVARAVETPAEVQVRWSVDADVRTVAAHVRAAPLDIDADR